MLPKMISVRKKLMNVDLNGWTCFRVVHLSPLREIGWRGQTEKKFSQVYTLLTAGGDKSE